jgi:protein TonB
MTAFRLRAAPPALRFGLSTLASLLLHAALLWPPGFARSRPPPPPRPPVLEAVLLAPALATRQEPPEPAAAEAPPTPPTATVPPEPSFARKPPPPRELRGRALDSALAALAQQDFYPREAIERGLEGDVVVLLSLDEEGAIAAADIATSSGHALLDAAALAAVKRIGRLPAARPQVLLPVRFRLD